MTRLHAYTVTRLEGKQKYKRHGGTQARRLPLIRRFKAFDTPFRGCSYAVSRLRHLVIKIIALFFGYLK